MRGLWCRLYGMCPVILSSESLKPLPLFHFLSNQHVEVYSCGAYRQVDNWFLICHFLNQYVGVALFIFCYTQIRRNLVHIRV